ncbi:MAG TPA: hypothetical protein VM122_00650 [Usitatibacter sp.]|nr:hypothetical protein [Usitatibacter sp.]
MDNADKVIAYKPAVRELASRIYVQFLSGTVAFDGGSAKMSVNAESLAKLAFKLADSFQGVEDELNAGNLPKNVGFKLDATDIAGWSK